MFIPGLFCRLALIFTLGILVMVSCSKSGVDEQVNVVGASTISLLLATPLIGNESEPRDPLPETTRLLLNEESVEGWPVPPEGTLRFPVQLGVNAKLSLRLGVAGGFQGYPTTLTFNIIFLQKTNNNGDNILFSKSHNLFETSVPGFTNLLNKWKSIDVSLDEWSGTTGEIQLVVDGDLSSHPDIQILWGAPSIYYPEERRHKNVLLIGVDTLRADAISPYGGRSELTPNIEAFTDSATLFTRAWSQAPWTLPSFASMVTGQFPSQINATGFSEHMPGRATTIGERLLPMGYSTYTACSISWLGNEQSGFQQGMEDLWFRQNAEAEVILARGMEFISRSIDRDWFCFLHFIDPHCPYDPSDQFDELVSEPGYDGPYKSDFYDCIDWPSIDLTPSESVIGQIRRLYDGEVAGVDAALGELFTFLEQNGLADDTLIVIASDHGEEFFDHDGFEHGHTQFEELVRMPLIVLGPGFPPGRRTHSSVGNIDIVPTILRYLDMSISDAMVGVPLQDFATNNGYQFGEERVIFGDETGGTIRLKFAVQWPYKCILDFLTSSARLYDLSEDPGETIDISRLYPEITSRLTQQIIETLRASQTILTLSIVGNPYEESHRFTGTIQVPGGIEIIKEYTFEDRDSYSLEGDTVTFDITSSGDVRGATKLLAVVPSFGAEIMKVELLVDERVDSERFFPYGTPEPERSGSATIPIYDFPWPASLPSDLNYRPSACYIVCIPGEIQDSNDVGGDMIELDPETLEQLRAIGYLN